MQFYIKIFQLINVSGDINRIGVQEKAPKTPTVYIIPL